jgi:hypothetical protein
MPVAGHVELHVGVAVNALVPPELTVGAVGLSATEMTLTVGVVMTVRIVDAPLVTPLSVALT